MISTKTFAEQSYLFALISELAYSDPANSAAEFKKLGFTKTKFFDQDCSEAYVLSNGDDIVIACRGTEVTQIKDIKADLRIKLVSPNFGPGKVHGGFKDSVDDVWANLSQYVLTLQSKQRQDVWVTGHSLGAAMATLMANEIHANVALPQVSAVFTYGSPKPGNKEFVESLTVTHYRWVNGADIVPRVPPAPYVHHGELHYLNHWGNVRKMTGFQQFKDRMRGFLKGWKSGLAQYGANHSISKYSDNLNRYANGVERDQNLFD